jgi:hypothetical protein
MLWEEHSLRRSVNKVEDYTCPEGFYNWYRCESIPEDSVLQP